MGLKGFGGSRTVIRAMALAAALSMGFAVTAPPPAKAEAEDSAFKKWKRNKAGGGNTTAAAAQSSHSAGSGTKATTVSGIVNDGSITPFLTADSSANMQAVAARYEAIVAAGGWPKVPSGKLKKGDTGGSAAALNRRLHIEGYLRKEATEGDVAEVFTTATEEALTRFQRNHGLAATGAMDGATLAALNVPAERRLSTIRANLPRVAEYSKDLGSRYVVVNIPAQQIETVSDGKVYSLHNAIVGRPSRPTPVVMTPLTIIRFNPYWNAPASIVEKDIVPRMLSRGASKVMDEMNMKIFDGVGGPEINPDRVNWRRVIVDNYHFRQEPGGSNAMATAKIEFNSPFGIYLHDTPEPHLFKTGQRFYSSGCVRVEQVATFIDWVLQGQDGIGASRIAELAETKERLDTNIANAPQLRVAYLTAWPTRDGVAAFRPDVYELDGTGFVVGQPLPVGTKQNGQRYVLKPIPRTPDAVDADEAIGFASLFRRGRDRETTSGVPPRRSSDDALVELETPKKKSAAKAKVAARKAKPGEASGKRYVRDPVDGSFKLVESEPTGSKKKVAKKGSDKSKTVTAKKVVKKDKTVAAAKKPDAKSADAKKVLAEAVAPKAGTKPKAGEKAKTASKKPAECKAAADGKLPQGCKPSASAKKPAAKPEKTTAAKPEKKTAAAN